MAVRRLSGAACVILTPLLLDACGGAPAGVAPAATAGAAPVAAAVPGAAATASGAPRARPGVHHEAAAKLATSLESADVSTAASLFTDDAVFVRWHAPDARGRGAIEQVLRAALDLCKMRVASVLERETSFVVQVESTCTHPKTTNLQAHLLIAELAGDRISRVQVYTELFPFHDRGREVVRELEAPETMTVERVKSATCQLDTIATLLPLDFRGTVTDVWGTRSCTVLTARSVDPEGPFHGYVEIDCGAPRSCRPSAEAHRYVNWNGQRLLPFADGVYLEKQE